MPVYVVHALEVVDIDHEYGEIGGAVGDAPVQKLVALIVGGPVWQSGQRIPVSPVLQASHRLDDALVRRQNTDGDDDEYHDQEEEDDVPDDLPHIVGQQVH